MALLPWPQSIRSAEVPSQQDGAQGHPTELTCTPADARVEETANTLLSGLACGRVDVRVGTVLDVAPQLGDDESYWLALNAEDESVEIVAATTWGALHGLRTLYQLAQPTGAIVHAQWQGLEIEDGPRFGWRGVLIDVARHFMPVAVLREVVDGLALLKMNVLHLHLTDDQGFRFPSATFPNAVSVDHYGADELRALVAYAADRGVRVLAEIDVPGHVTCWVAGHPELGSQAVEATTRFGVHPACLDPTSEQVYQGLDALFGEVADVFPDRYIHIGGDEVAPSWWRDDERVQDFIAAHGLADERALQNHFNVRLVEALRQRGKIVVGWDEVLHGDMPELVVQNWRGATTRDRALAAGRDCIVSAPYYLDLAYSAGMHYEHDPELEQAAWLALEDAQQADARLAHVAGGIEWTKQWRQGAVDAAKVDARVLGGEACLWSEIVDGDGLAVRLFSRLPAVAERLWSAADVRDEATLYARMEELLAAPPFVLAERQAARLQSLGLTGAQIAAAAFFEPVKWYARLLGQPALEARLAGSEMPQARPYTMLTPLDHIVDALSPESLPARALEEASDAALEAELAAWRELQPRDWPQDAHAIVAALVEVAEVVTALRDGALAAVEAQARLAELYTPRGEYMLAVVPPLRRRLGLGD